MLMQAKGFPEFRAYTFGAFRLERLVTTNEPAGQAPVYAPIPRAAWRGRGSGRRLLRFLLCRGAMRRAHREVILHALWPGEREERVSDGGPSLNAAVHNIAVALPPSPGREPLLTLEREEHSYFYELVGAEQLWVDLDEFEALMERASRAMHNGEDPLPLWEQAHVLSCGEFLPEDRYSSWMEERRREVEAAQHRCTHRLALLYTERAQEDRAEGLLIQVLEQRPCEEDALHRLMMILARQGRNQEALRYYRRSMRAIQEVEQRKISKRLQELAEHLRSNPVLVVRLAPPLSSGPESSLGLPARGGPLSVQSAPSTETHQGGSTPELLQGIEPDCPDLCLGVFSTYLFDLISRWRYLEEPFAAFETRLANEIGRLQNMQPRSSHGEQEALAWKLSRRQALASLVVLPTSLLFQVRQEPKTVLVIEEFLPRSAAALTAGTQLLDSNDFALVELSLSKMLPQLEELAREPSEYQQEAAKLASKGYQLVSVINLHRNELSLREENNRRAIEYARLANDADLLVGSLDRLALTFYYTDMPTKMLHTYQEALQSANQISPEYRSLLHLGLAGAYARCSKGQEADRALHVAKEQFAWGSDFDQRLFYTYAGFTPYSLLLAEGSARLDMEQYQQAWNVFTSAGSLSSALVIPERIRLEILNHQAEAALGMRDMEMFCSCIKAGRDGAIALGSEKRYQEAFEVYKQGRRLWALEKRVRELGDLFVR